MPGPLEFTVCPEHMKLLARTYIGWEDSEFGAPAVDPKRPYGNSYVYGDIAKTLGIAPTEDDGFSGAQKADMRRLHEEMQTVLQILVRHAATGVRAGETFVRSAAWQNDWTLKP